MSISIKSNSPLQTTAPTVVIGSANNELWFTSSASTLYTAILRYNIDTTYTILTSNVLRGYDNATNYDYRVNLNNYIKIQHNTPTYVTGSNYGYIATPITDVQSKIYVLVATTDLLTTNSAYIGTKSNGEKYVTTANMASVTASELKQEWTFQNYADFTFNIDDKLYRNSKFLITIGNNASYVIDYVKFYDSSNNLIGTHGYTAPTGATTTLVSMFADVPDNASYVKYKLNGGSEVTKYVEPVCATNQYFYFNDIISSLTCTAKRELVRSAEKQSVQIGNVTKTLAIKYTDKYTQNTGFFLNQQNILDIVSTPYLFEVSGSAINKYLLDDTELSGYNTRRLSEKNDTITLKSDTVSTRYTSFQNNFYD